MRQMDFASLDSLSRGTLLVCIRMCLSTDVARFGLLLGCEIKRGCWRWRCALAAKNLIHLFIY